MGECFRKFIAEKLRQRLHFEGSTFYDVASNFQGLELKGCVLLVAKSVLKGLHPNPLDASKFPSLASNNLTLSKSSKGSLAAHL